MGNHKYIDRYRSKNTGKWVYVYRKAGYTKRVKDYGTGESYTIKVPDTKVYKRNSNKLLSSTFTKSDNKGNRSEYREIGKIDRTTKYISKGFEKVGKLISKNYKSFTKESNKQINKAKKWIQGLF